MEAQAEGVIESCEVVFRGRRQLQARLRDDSGELLLRFLNFYGSTQKQLAVGRRVRVYGAVRVGSHGVLPEMVHPRVRVTVDAPLPARLTPVYPTTEGVPQSWLRRRIDTSSGILLPCNSSQCNATQVCFRGCRQTVRSIACPAASHTTADVGPSAARRSAAPLVEHRF